MDSFVDVLINALVGQIFSSLLTVSVKSKVALYLSRMLKGDDHTHESFKRILRVALCEAVNRYNVPAGELRQIIEAQEFRELMIEWICSDSQELNTLASSIDHRLWNINVSSGINVTNFLIEVAVAIQKAKNNHFSPETQATMSTVRSEGKKVTERLQKLEEQVGSLSSHNERIEHVRMLVRDNSFKTARTIIEELLERHLSNEDKEEPLTLLVKCLVQLPDDAITSKVVRRLSELHDLMRDRRRQLRIKALIEYHMQDFTKALGFIDQALVMAASDAQNLLLKANILIATDNRHDAKVILDSIESESNGETKVAIAQSYVQLSEYAISERLCIDVLQTEPRNVKALLVLTEVYYEKCRTACSVRNVHRDISADDLEDLERYATRCQETVNPEDDRTRYEINAMLGVVYTWKSETTEAAIYFSNSLAISPDDHLVNLGLAKAFFELGKYVEALEILNRLQDDTEVFALRQYVSVYMPNGVSTVVSNIDDHLSQSKSSDDEIVSLSEIKALALTKNIDTSDAERLVDTLVQLYPHVPYVYRIKAEFLKTMNMIPEGIQCLEEIGLDPNGDSFELIAGSLIDLYAQSNVAVNRPKAIALLEQIVSPCFPKRRMLQYVRCLYDNGEYGKCIIECNAVENLHGFIPEFGFVKALVQYRCEEFVEAGNLFQIVYKATSNNLEALKFYSICQLRLGKYDKAINAIRRARDSTNLEFAIIATDTYRHAASVTMRVDWYRKAVEYGYNALQLSGYKREIVDSYIGLVVFIPNGLGVSLDLVHSQEATRLFNNYKDLFPDSKTFKQFQIPSDPDLMIASFIEAMPDNRPAFEAALDIYNRNKLCLSWLSQRLGKDAFELWRIITNAPNTGFWMHLMSDNSYAKENSALISSSEIIIDAVSLFALNKLDLLPALSKTFERIFISQSTFDEIVKMRLSTMAMAENGIGHMSFVNGQLAFVQKDEDAAKADLEFINDIFQFALDSCEKVGTTLDKDYVHAENPAINRSSLTLGYGKSVVDTMSESKARSKLLFSDEQLVRQMTRELFDQQATSTLGFLYMLHSTSQINTETYADKLALLVRLNYHCVPIDVDTILTLLRLNAFATTPTINILFENLFRSYWNAGAVENFVLQLLRTIWREAATLHTKKLMTDRLISGLMTLLPKHQVLRLLHANAEQIISPLDPVNMDEFVSVVDVWRRQDN